jgi:dTDP-4-amino-4,6-dideoxygalactose transaminase
MKANHFTRRRFINAVSAGSVAAIASGAVPLIGRTTANAEKLAILGGEPVRKNKTWPVWPYVDDKVIDSILKTTRSGIWCRIQSRTGTVATFEKAYAELMGTRVCVAVGSGTQALSTCVEALGIGPGDEVITSPYTDPGTISSILTSRALPVLADLDRESFQLDPDDVERKITENTKAIMPVHIWGSAANMEQIMMIARKHNLKVIEDAAQAHLSEYQGKKLGTIGDLGCFSFQAGKTIACGEGGAVIGNDEELMDKCFTVQNHGTSKKGLTETIGPKYRMNEFEAAILLGQLDGVKERFTRRNENAAYLSSKLKGFPGIVPQKQYKGTGDSSYYYYAMSYRREHFNDAEISKFVRVMAAEGIGLSTMYNNTTLNKQPWTDHILTLKVYQKMYSPARLKKFREELHLPVCDKVEKECVQFSGSGRMLGTRDDMDDVITAIMKVYDNRDKLSSI